MSPLNLIILGSFPYPQGMAGTKLMRALVHGMKGVAGVSIQVVILRQSSLQNPLAGIHDGVPYETVMGDLAKAKAALLAPVLCLKTVRVLKREFRSGSHNVILNYGPPELENFLALRWCRRLGYKIVFYIVEDYNLAWAISRSISHRLKVAAITRLQRSIGNIASGIIVITSHLQEKYDKLTNGKTPLLHSAIAIDFDRFPGSDRPLTRDVTLFYSGSLGTKDGLPVLLDAFDQLAARRPRVRLVLTGRGEKAAVAAVMSRIQASPQRDRIDYKGYLDDEAYSAALEASSIPCMTRVDTGYANAGFPYKLGEYLATGKPVIASRVSDVERMFEHGRDALLVKPGDSGEIVAAVDDLIANPQEASAVGARGRRKARTLFDCRRRAEKTLAFIRGL